MALSVDIPAKTAAARSDDQLRMLVELRRELHAHPELPWQEHRTTELVAAVLTRAGLTPRVLPGGTGVLCDIGPAPARVALRADIDALPIPDTKDVEYRSTVAGVAHACGHDVHTVVVLGAGLALARLAARGELPHGVRLVFQPAEEEWPGGAVDVIKAGGLDGIEEIYALHCDPSIEVGGIGLRAGPITGASDHLEVRLTGPGGHSARGHLTADLVAALAAVVSQVPAVLARRVDPRAALILVWGHIAAGSAPNAIPDSGVVRGRLRTLSRPVWESLPPLVDELIRSVATPYGVGVEISHIRGVPPVVNDAACVGRLDAVVRSMAGVDVRECEQSLGGEDFAWYVDQVPGALARLGVREPGVPAAADLHQSGFDVDERCIPIGVDALVGVALDVRPARSAGTR
ncbi:amidohydrolase [Labedaea rhizosphaerae]|uniref:Amidohydrolase n=1 Tax=Labedaea rhizosphaerae TaxID=598644 RepID=A0A4R6SHV0_LABRH|nr:amidohydrolase [Labedaea rhizosphaerae]TDQ00528.1 amidohydrolase [Labedaea rhizosphaerae]